jgi:hypothetical protein
VQVLVNHAGADVGDFGAFGEPVDDERVQILVVPHSDVDKEILGPRDHEDSDRLGQRAIQLRNPSMLRRD